jgi:hypothetical protein
MQNQAWLGRGVVDRVRRQHLMISVCGSQSRRRPAPQPIESHGKQLAGCDRVTVLFGQWPR